MYQGLEAVTLVNDFLQLSIIDWICFYHLLDIADYCHLFDCRRMSLTITACCPSLSKGPSGAAVLALSFTLLAYIEK